MIIYNVTVNVDKDIAEQWVEWMKNEHVPELMSTGLFSGHKLCHLLEHDEAEGVTYVAQYFCDTIDKYNNYIDHHATHMRQKALDRFGSKFTAFRTLMEVI